MWHRQAFFHADLQGPRLTPTADLEVETEAFKWITAGAKWVDSEIQVLDSTAFDQHLPVVLIPSRARVEIGHLPADRTELRKLLEQYHAFPALPFRTFCTMSNANPLFMLFGALMERNKESRIGSAVATLA